MMKKHCQKTSKNLNIFVKIFLLFAILGIFPTVIYAATSDTINFQGKIVRNDTGSEGLNVVAGTPACVVAGSSNDTCDFQVKYYDAVSAGNLLLTETYTNVEIGEYNGAFNLSLGSDGTPTAGTYSAFEDMVVGEGDLYVELLFDPTGASTFTETFSRMSVQATAYALKAKYASGANTAFQFDSAADDSGYTSPVAGMVYYDSDESVLKMYNGSSWEDVGGSSGSSLFTDGGAYTYLTSLADHLVLGANSYTAIGSSTYESYIDTNIGTMPPFAFDMGAERLTLSGNQQQSGLTVYSDYNGASPWPLVSFKAEYTGFTNTVLELVQDGTGDLLSLKKGSTEVFKVDNNGAVYLHEYTSFGGTTADRLYNVNGTLYWDGSALGSGGGLWTDSGTYSYLTSTTDDVIIGGDSAANAKFFFDVSTGNLGIGTSTPGAKLDIAGSSSTISNSTGDLTISADDTVVIKANDTENDNLMEWHDSTGNILSLINQNGYATFGDSTSAGNAILAIGANTSSVAQINLSSSLGTDVAAPNNGDLWWNGTNLYFFDGTDRVDLLAGGAGAGLYSENGSVSNDGYLELVHNEDSFDLIADGWVCVGGAQDASCTGGNWKNVADSSLTIGHYLSNVWDDADSDGLIRSDVRLTNVELSPGIDVGTGADGDVTISANTDINAINSIAGRICADGGDAVNYSVTTLTDTTATLSAIPSAGCISAGDEVLLINLMGSSTNYSNVGNYETIRVAGVTNNVITFETSKQNLYGDNGGDSNIGTGSGSQKVMVQRVPHYHDITVDASMSFYPTSWNGVKGGVIFFRANGSVAVNGSVHADGSGFLGGAGGSSTREPGGYSGQSYNGSNVGTGGGTSTAASAGGGRAAREGTAAPANYFTTGGGGGGGASGSNNGDETGGAAGGGGYAGGGGGGGSGGWGSAGGAGGIGGDTGVSAGGGAGAGTGGAAGGNAGSAGSNNTGVGGPAGSGALTASGGGGGNNGGDMGGAGGGGGGLYGTQDLSSIYFGSGGGGGGGGRAGAGTAGASGGGIVMIEGTNITVNGSVKSTGGAATAVSHGGGGGGAGGSVKISGVTVAIGTSNVTALGGDGSYRSGSMTGGQGGVGRVAVYYIDSLTGSSSTPTPYTTEGSYSSYGLYHSPVINTPNAKTYDSVKWNEYLDTYGNISVQTRSGEAETREKGLDFDAHGNYLVAGNTTDYNYTSEDFSIEMWIKPNQSNALQMLAGTGDSLDWGYYFDITNNGELNFVTCQSGVNQTTDTAGGTVDYGEWQHIAVTRTGSTVTIYKNGVNVTETHGTHINPVTSPDPFTIGEYATNAGNTTSDYVYHYNGQMDEVRVWSDVRTSTELTNNMNVDLTGSEANLVGYWPLDEMSGGTAEDLSSTGSDLTIYNADWTEFYDWESWKPFSLTTNYLVLESMDTHTSWTGTNMTVEENADRYTQRNVKMFEDEDEATHANITKLTSSTNGGYAEATITSTDLSTYDYITAWVRVSESGNTVKLGVGEAAGNEEEETVTIDEANEWQKIYWDISDITDTSRDGITKLRLTNLSGVANTIYLDNIRAEKLRDSDRHMKVESTPNDYFQYRVIFTTTNTSYQPRLENITLSYNSGYDIVLVDSNTVRLYNYSGEDQYLKLDVATGAASGSSGDSGSGFSGGIAVSDVTNGTDAVAFAFNTSETFSDPSSKLLSVMNNGTEKMYLDSEGNLYVAGAIISEKGLGSVLTNNSGGTISERSLVTIDPSAQASFTTTTTENKKGAFGVVQGVDVNNDGDKDGNCDHGDKCFVVFDGVTEVNTVDATSSGVGQYVFSSTTAGSAKTGDYQDNGLIGIVTSTADAASGYLTIVFDAQNQSTADMYVNGIIEKDIYRDMYSQLSADYASMSLAERRGDIEEGSQAVLFDTFLDSLKMDIQNSTVGLDTNENRAGLWGDLDVATGSTDILGNYFMGASGAIYSTSIYYDRTQSGEQGQDSTPEVLVDLGIDPNWFNGVTLQSNCTVNCSVNSNLSTTYNGGLFDISGTYGVSSEHGSLLIDVVGHTASGITANIASTDGSCSVSGASLTYEEAYTFNAGSCSGSSITITPSATDFNIGDTFRVASWLLEPETSNDRGDKRVFPERSIILGSDDGTYFYVTILDADTERVWMTFIADSDSEASGNMLMNNSNVDVRAMDMLNGKLSVSGYGYTDETTSMRIDFINDISFAFDPYSKFEYGGTIGDRNDASGYTEISTATETVYDSHVNDLDMEVVPNMVTQEVTQTGWGYMQGGDSDTIYDTVYFDNGFNGIPEVTISHAGRVLTTAPNSLSDCTNGLLARASTEITTRSVTDENFGVTFARGDGYLITTDEYVCYTWTATAEVSPKEYTAYSSRDTVSLINNTDGEVGHVAHELVSTNDYQQVLIDPVRSKVWYVWDYNGDGYSRLWGLDISKFETDDDVGSQAMDFEINSHPNSAVAKLSSGSVNAEYSELSINWKTGNLFLSNDSSGVDVISIDDDGNIEIKHYQGGFISEYIPTGTQAYWPLEMDNTSYDMEDGSYEGKTLTAVNMDTNDAISGIRGKGASFNGTDEYFYREYDTDFNLGDEGTIGAWVKSSSSTGMQNIMGLCGCQGGDCSNDHYNLNLNSGNAVGYWNSTDDGAVSISSSSSIADGEWHYVATTFGNGEISLYVDGEKVSSQSVAGTIQPSDGDRFYIGARWQYSVGMDNYFNGDIDEPIVIAKALTQSQIQKMYQSGKKALTGSHEINDTYNNIETDDARSIMVDPDGNFMYVGTEGYGMQKVDLTSDTVVERTSPIGSGNIERVNGRYKPVFVGDINWKGHFREIDTNGSNTSGIYYSKTFELEENTTDAYLWLKAYSDDSDPLSEIAVSISNDGGSTYESATLIHTETLDNGEKEYEYSVDFTNPDNDVKVKVEMDRGISKKSTIYISEWGLATLNTQDITGNGMYTETNTSIADGEYVEVVHNQNTYNIVATGWVKEDGQWVELKNPSISAGQYLSNVWNDADPDGVIRSDVRLTNIELASGLNLGTGEDGDINISANTVIDTTNSISGRTCADGGDAVNYSITAFNTGGTEATLSSIPSSGCLNIGDEVMIINLQGTATATVNIGNYETLEVLSVSGSTVTFKTPKMKYYGDNGSDDTNIGTSSGNQKVMLQRVPNYNDVTVTNSATLSSSSWNGVKGGVIFFRASGSVEINSGSAISAAASGYRGGPGYTTNYGDYAYGYQGESYAGQNSSRATSVDAYYSGGGAGKGADASGGGGAHIGVGLDGDKGLTNSVGGLGSTDTYDSNISDKLYFGSGGGASGSHIGRRSVSGGNGGGIIYISADNVSNSGAIQAHGGQGATGIAEYDNSSGAGGGGGAGGTVNLYVKTISTGNAVYSYSGAGGPAAGGSAVGKPGGDGGDGIVRIFSLDSVNGSTTPTAYSVDVEYNSYGLYHSPVMETLDAQSYDYLKWEEDLDQYGEIGIQTRSGSLDSERNVMSFDGDGDYLTSTTNYDYTSEDFTIEMWLKPTNLNGDLQVLFDNGSWQVDGYFIEINAQSGYAFGTSQSGAVQYSSSGTNSATEGEWQHMAFVRSGSNVDIYKNGVDITSTHGTHINPVSTTKNLRIGDYLELDRYFTGGMDEIRVWSEARTQTEIQNNMNTELTGSETNLAGYWNMNDTKSNTVTDSTSSGNDLTIVGAKRDVDREYAWESWKPFSLTTNYLMLESADTHTNWVGTNTTVAEGDVIRDVKMFEDEDESTVGNMTKLTSSTDGGYAEATISSTDLSTYDYITAWVRASESGNTLKLSVGETTGNEQEEQITIDKADKWQKIYWDISDIESTDKDAITRLRFTNLSGVSNTIYLDNVRAEKLVTDTNSMKIQSTANDYFQYRVIFTTTNTAYQPKLENISLTYGGGGYEIVMVDADTVRLYNHTGENQELRLDVITGSATTVYQGLVSSVTLAPTIAQVDLGNNTNSIWINKMGAGGNLLKLQTNNTDMFVVDSSGNLSMNGDLEVEGGVLSLGTSGDQGSIRYNTTNDQLEFTNNGTDWMVLGGMSKTETLSAEYAGATISEDGTDNVGTMTSDSEGSASDSMNYYEWNSSEVALNDYDIRVRFTLPSDFDSWGTGGGITLNYATESTSSSANQVDFYVYEESSATVDASSEDLVSSVAGEWTTSNIAGTSLTDCDTAGEVCVLVIRMASSGDNYVRIGDIEFTYDRSL